RRLITLSYCLPMSRFLEKRGVEPSESAGAGQTVFGNPSPDRHSQILIPSVAHFAKRIQITPQPGTAACACAWRTHLKNPPAGARRFWVLTANRPPFASPAFST